MTEPIRFYRDEPLPLNVHGSEVVWSNLYEDMPDRFQDEDLIYIRLVDGTAIDVGSYRTEDGWVYQVDLIANDDWDNPVRRVVVDTPASVAAVIEEIARNAAQSKVAEEEPSE